MHNRFLVNIVDVSGRYLTCEDDKEHIGDWIVRTMDYLMERNHLYDRYEIKIQSID